MEEKYKIAIVGNKETILGFKALGVEVHNANNPTEALAVLTKLKSCTPAYAIIFITEDLAMGIATEDHKKLNIDALPAIIPLPGINGSTGYGIKRIGKMVEQAVGSDIFKE